MRQKLKAKAPKPAAPGKRARLPREPLAAFLDEIFVVCPRCAGPAVSRRLEPEARDTRAPRRLVCRRCGHLQESRPAAAPVAARAGLDDYFRMPLWLATPCCGELLWAFNARHLAALEAYALAALRERRRDAKHGWSNQSFASRLPRWIKAAKNRAEVDRGLARLRARLSEIK